MNEWFYKYIKYYATIILLVTYNMMSNYLGPMVRGKLMF